MVTARRNQRGALTEEEKRITRALLDRGERNQDIQALINLGRDVTINSARISEVRKNINQQSASDEEVEFYKLKKQSLDPKTSLNLFDDERLIRSREAMILAVQIFNSPALNFKTEVFSVLANIAWTYLLHEYYERQNISIVGNDGKFLSLSQMISRHDCPLSAGMKNNLQSLKEIRDEVEHKLLRRGDLIWQGKFQACCLNFDNFIRKNFGESLSLAGDLSFALQFQKPDIEQINTLNQYEVPPQIAAIDARISENLTPEQRQDIEYEFRVIYTLDIASKSRVHFQFFNSDSAEAKEIRNVAVNYKPADDFYPYKPKKVCELVQERAGKNFNIHNHTQAWKLFRVRPADGRQPENTNKDYCIYHSAHRDYTYSEKWVHHLIDQVNDPEKLTAIKSFKI